jgi:hypothetical protein
MKDVLLWFLLLLPFNFMIMMCVISVIMNRFKKIKLSDDLYQSIKLNKKGK